MPDKEKVRTEYKSYQQDNKKIALMLKMLNAGEKVRQTQINTYKKMKSAYNRVFDVDNISVSGKKDIPNIIRSGLSRTLVEVMAKGLRFPEPRIFPVNDLDPKAREKTSMGKSLLEWSIRESGIEGVYRRAKKPWMAYGDSFRRPTVRTTPSGKKKMEYESIRVDRIIPDPDGVIIDSKSYADKWQMFGLRLWLTREQALQIIDEELLDKYVQTGGALDASNDGKNTEATQYYEFLEWHSLGSMSEIYTIGSNMVPVIAFCEGYDFSEHLPKDLVESEKTIYSDEYRFKDRDGDPYLNLSQFICYLNEDGPFDYGVVQKVYTLQYAHEISENGKIDNFRRRLDEIVYVSNIRPNIFRQLQDDYRQRKAENLTEVMALPPSLNGAPPAMGVVEYPSLDPRTAENMVDGILDMARNIVGSDPKRLEIQKYTGVGQTQILQEQESESQKDIIDENLVSFTSEAEKLLRFAIVNEGFGRNKTLIKFTKYFDDKGEELPVPIEATISVAEAAKKLGDFDYFLFIDPDSIIERSNAVLAERIIQLIGIVDVNAFPDLYKRLILELNKTMRTNITDKDLEQQGEARPLGGNSQFQRANETNTRPAGEVPLQENIPQGGQGNLV